MKKWIPVILFVLALGAVAFALGYHFKAVRQELPVALTSAADEVAVSTVEELLKALKSDRTIRLRPGDYVFDDSNLNGGEGPGKFAGLSPHYKDFAFQNLENLTLEGAGEGVRILQPDGYNWVMSFLDVKNLRLSRLTLGHSVDKGYCQGGVLRVVNGTNVKADHLDLFGSGTEGLSLAQVDGFTLEDSRIHDCTEQLATVTESRDVRLVRTSIKNNDAKLRGFTIHRSTVTFEDSEVADNTSEADGAPDYGTLLLLDSGDYVYDFVRSGLSPAAKPVTPPKTLVRFVRTKLERNGFTPVPYDPEVVRYD